MQKTNIDNRYHTNLVNKNFVLTRPISLSSINTCSLFTPIAAKYAAEESIQIEDPTLYATIQQAIHEETRKSHISPLLVLALNQKQLTMDQKASLTIQAFLKDRSIADGTTPTLHFQQYWMLPLPYMDNNTHCNEWLDALLEEAKKPVYGDIQDHKSKQLAIHELKDRRFPSKRSNRKKQDIINLDEEVRWLRDRMDNVQSIDDWVCLLDEQEDRYCSEHDRINPYYRYISDIVFIVAAQSRPSKILNEIIDKLYGDLVQKTNSNSVALLQLFERTDAGLHQSYSSRNVLIEQCAPHLKVPPSIKETIQAQWAANNAWIYKHHWLSTPESIAYLREKDPERLEQLISIAPPDFYGTEVEKPEDLSGVLAAAIRHEKPTEHWINKNRNHWAILLEKEYTNDHIQQALVHRIKEDTFMLDSEQGPTQMPLAVIQHLMNSKTYQPQIADAFYNQRKMEEPEHIVGWYHTLVQATPWKTLLKPFKSDVYSLLYKKPLSENTKKDLVATILSGFTHLQLGNMHQIKNTLSSLEAIGFEQPPSQWTQVKHYHEIPFTPEA